MFYILKNGLVFVLYGDCRHPFVFSSHTLGLVLIGLHTFVHPFKEDFAISLLKEKPGNTRPRSLTPFQKRRPCSHGSCRPFSGWEPSGISPWPHAHSPSPGRSPAGPPCCWLPPPREDLQPGTTPRWGTTRTSSRAREREKLKGVKGF